MNVGRKGQPGWKVTAALLGCAAWVGGGCGSEVRWDGRTTSTTSDCDSEGIDCMDACGNFYGGSCVDGTYVCDDPGTGGCGGQGGMGGSAAAEWSLGLGDHDGYQAGNAVAVAPGGDILLAACFASTIDFGGGVLVNADPDAPFDCDVALARLSAEGQHIWSRGFGAANKQFPTDVAVDDAGNAVMIGSFSGSINFGLGELAPPGTFLAKFDLAGNTLWSLALPVTGEPAVAIDPENRIIVAGTCAPDVDLGGGPVQTAGGTDACVVAFDPDGTYLWHHALGGPATDQAADVAVNGSGEIAVCGSFTGSMSLGNTVLSIGSGDGFVAQVDALAGPLWGVALGGLGPDGVSGVAWDPEGAVVAGWFEGSADFGGGPKGSPGRNGFVVWLGATGAYRADVVYRGVPTKPFGTEWWTIAADPDGGILLGGQFQDAFQIGPFDIDQAGDHEDTSDGALARLYPAGEVDWAIGFGDPYAERVNGIAAAPLGSVLVTGSYFGGPDLGAGKLPGAGNGDLYLASFPLHP
jgi:hypothetical protein